MEKIEHNLDKERKFLELLGYSLIGPNKSNRWTILDDNEKEVGYIQYKKIYKGNKKKNFSKIFAYHTVINSSRIIYDYTRKANDVHGKTINEPEFFYEFDIRRKYKTLYLKTTHVELSLGSDFYLKIWDKKYGYMDFHIDYEGLFLNYTGKTSKYNFEKTVIYNNNVDDYNQYKEYLYNFSYWDRNLEFSFLDSVGRTTKEIRGVFYPYNNTKNESTLFEKTWVDGERIISKNTKTQETIEQLARNHKKGIDSFHYFISLVNEIIPFKDDIILQIIQSTSNDEKNKETVSLFLETYEKELEESDNQKKLIKVR